MPYQQKYSELRKLEEELKNPPIVDPFYYLWISFLEIYLVKEQTRQLPEILPANLPKDPFSGQDFEYETTRQGFVLRCREEEIGQKEAWEYEFVIAQ